MDDTELTKVPHGARKRKDSKHRMHDAAEPSCVRDGTVEKSVEVVRGEVAELEINEFEDKDNIKVQRLEGGSSESTGIESDSDQRDLEGGPDGDASRGFAAEGGPESLLVAQVVSPVTKGGTPPPSLAGSSSRVSGYLFLSGDDNFLDFWRWIFGNWLRFACHIAAIFRGLFGIFSRLLSKRARASQGLQQRSGRRVRRSLQTGALERPHQRGRRRRGPFSGRSLHAHVRSSCAFITTLG
jgi:hypothetical protein